MPTRRDNATWLFVREQREFRHSETWWTALFTILAALRAQTGNPLKLPVYSACGHGLCRRIGEIDLAIATTANTATDLCLSNVFSLQDQDDPVLAAELSGLKPDIVVRDTATRHVVLIEVKTVGTSVKRNAGNYDAIRKRLTGWNTELLYLVSAGHESRGDWPVFQQYDSRLILWEDVLAAVEGSPLAGLFNEPLAPYRRCMDYTVQDCAACAQRE